jgi:hypothetical protein
MAHFLHSIFRRTVRKRRHLFLALSWILGLGFGGFVFRYAGSHLVSRMPLAYFCQPPIPGLLISTLLPFLFSASAVYFSTPKLLPGICFCKAFMLGYVCCGVFAVSAGAGWLVRYLFLFTDLWGAALLYHYCSRHISGVRAFSPGAIGIYGCFLLAAALVDHRFILPLLQRCLS